MKKRELKVILRSICRHGRILMRGMWRTVYSTLVAGLAALAVIAFAAIPGEQGYVAVTDFIAAVSTMAVALVCIYCLGEKPRKTKKN